MLSYPQVPCYASQKSDIIKDMKNITQPLKLIALASILSIGISYVSAWTAPTVTPPNGNVAAPVNVGNTAQTKTGNLTANYLTASSESNAPVFKDTSDTSYFLNPNGDSVLANIYATRICFGADCKTAWPSGGATYSAGNGLSLSGTTFSINNTQAQARVSGNCAVGSSIRVINADGTVSCQVDSVGGGAETDPTVPASVKDGISWTEVSGKPIGFADGVDNTGGTVVFGAHFTPPLNNECNNMGNCTCPNGAVQVGTPGSFGGDTTSRMPVCSYITIQ